jgi:hypothetical protein
MRKSRTALSLGSVLTLTGGVMIGSAYALSWGRFLWVLALAVLTAGLCTLAWAAERRIYRRRRPSSLPPPKLRS